MSVAAESFTRKRNRRKKKLEVAGAQNGAHRRWASVQGCSLSLFRQLLVLSQKEKIF